MGGRFLCLGLVMAACARLAFAQQTDETPPPSFSAPVLDQPAREETGPLAKKPIERRSSAPDLTLTPTPDATPLSPLPNVAPAPATETPAPAAPPLPPAAPADETRLRGYVDGVMSALISAGEIPGATVLVIQDGKIALKA